MILRVKPHAVVQQSAAMQPQFQHRDGRKFVTAHMRHAMLHEAAQIGANYELVEQSKLARDRGGTSLGEAHATPVTQFFWLTPYDTTYIP